MARFRFSVLGPLRADWDGRPIPIGGVQQRALLILLLIHRDRAMSADALVEALFDEPVPSTALQRLQVTVSRLRRTLRTETSETLISTEAGGYRLDASRADLDIDRLESALSEARTLLASDAATWRSV